MISTPNPAVSLEAPPAGDLPPSGLLGVTVAAIAPSSTDEVQSNKGMVVPTQGSVDDTTPSSQDLAAAALPIAGSDVNLDLDSAQPCAEGTSKLDGAQHSSTSLSASPAPVPTREDATQLVNSELHGEPPESDSLDQTTFPTSEADLHPNPLWLPRSCTTAL